ncbi:hypothetical protein ACJBT4_10420, partial [Streptococcus suis]
VAIDRQGVQFAHSYMDVSTGQFFVTSLDDFTSICGEIRNLRARELVIGYDLSEEEEQVFSNKMNLLLSFEDEVKEDVQ